jgi:hypothetical protein
MQEGNLSRRLAAEFEGYPEANAGRQEAVVALQ